MILRYLENPHSLSKQELYSDGLLLVKTFLRKNNFYRTPVFEVKNEMKDYGLCHEVGLIQVNLTLAKYPMKNPGYSWSYPGYKSDLTPIGILSHETGHWVQHQLGKRFQEQRARWYYVLKIEQPVSGYEPSPTEAFAEAMKLFISNPDLLRVGRPIRYKFIESLGLKGVFKGDWRSVLKHAHSRLVDAAVTWVDKKHIPPTFTRTSAESQNSRHWPLSHQEVSYDLGV